jgi:hypothetical protein
MFSVVPGELTNKLESHTITARSFVSSSAPNFFIELLWVDNKGSNTLTDGGSNFVLVALVCRIEA